ncbi:hypothetical protein [Chloroflexus aurantiacus]|uniref:hypothetical protein n=1 Tax=Chloroflexus aurantiacus TaxID=1108 RepID=UPI000173D220|nr:hypothetical protein [Chloroflexus aurantiacus]
MKQNLCIVRLLTPPPPPAPPAPPSDPSDQQGWWSEEQFEQDGQMPASLPFWHPKAIRRALRLPMV